MNNITSSSITQQVLNRFSELQRSGKTIAEISRIIASETLEKQRFLYQVDLLLSIQQKQ